MGYTPGVYEQIGVDCFSQRGEVLYVDTLARGKGNSLGKMM